ncbi:MAG TPA: hypothetical protein VGY54_19935, partial [Polyangiaceae bacterium]|nr:hypothetical protein [Polyangiaceae bacterium]
NLPDVAVDAAYACAPQAGPLGWSPWSGSLPAAALNAVWGSTARDVWAVGDYGTAVHWDCATWSRVSLPAPISDLRGVWGSSSADVWAVGHRTNQSPMGTVFHWDGVSWSLSIDVTATFAVTGLRADLNAVWGASADDVWAVGGGGFWDGVGFREYCDPLILHWDGMAWSRVAGPKSASGWVLRAIAGISSTDVWAVGYRCYGGHSTNDEVLHWDGQLWSEVLTGLPDYSRLTAVAAALGWSVWAAGDFQWDGGSAHLARWGGSAWTVDPNEPDINPAVNAPTISSLWAGGATVGWAVGAYGLVLGWDGNQWTRTASGTVLDLRGVWGSSAKEAWAVGGTSSTSRGITTSSGIVLHYVGQ